MALLHRVRSVLRIASSHNRLCLRPASVLTLSVATAISLTSISLSWPGVEGAQGAEEKGGTEATPPATKGIQPLDLLSIRAAGTLVDLPVDGVFLVEPSGKVALGPAYGRVEVKGLTMEQAEIVIEKQLRRALPNPEVQVTAAGRVTKWRSGEPPKAPYRIRPNDLVRIHVLNTLLDQPIDGDFLVEPSGKVPLGPVYGRVKVEGLTVEDAEPVIEKHLKEVLRQPVVLLTLAGWTGDLQLGTNLEWKMAELDLQIRIAKGEVAAIGNMRAELEARIKDLRTELEKIRKRAPVSPRGEPTEGNK